MNNLAIVVAFLVGLVMGVVIDRSIPTTISVKETKEVISIEEVDDVKNIDRMREVDGIKIKEWPASRLREYHVREDLGRVANWHRGFSHILENAVMEDLSRIDGVVEIRKANYTVDIIIGVVYSWEEVEPKVLEILKKKEEEVNATRGKDFSFDRG
jgi:hypothetical protein